jgi:hypothetical protein
MNESDSQQAQDESSSSLAERAFARGQCLALGVSIVLVPVVIFFSFFIYKAVNEVHSFAISFPFLLILGLFVLLSLCVPFILLRRKWTTGRFTVTRAEAMAKQEAMWNKLGAGKPLRPQIWFVMGPIILLAFFLVVAILPISLLSHLGSRPPLFLLILIVFLSATILALPAWFLFKTIRRKLKTGSFLLSQDEIAKFRARTRKPVPVGSSILTASSMWMIAGTMIATQITAYRHLRTPETYTWGIAALCLGVSFLWILQVFRPFKPLCAVPE